MFLMLLNININLPEGSDQKPQIYLWMIFSFFDLGNVPNELPCTKFLDSQGLNCHGHLERAVLMGPSLKIMRTQV